jgi:ABC-type branched-subunit amino acid transport system ATPase component
VTDEAVATDAASRPHARLEVRDLSAGYGRQEILFDISASFPSKHVTTIIGPNGAGKSTFIKALYGLARVTSGTILLEGQPVRPNARSLVKLGIAYVPQVRNVFGTLTVQENLEIGTYVRSAGSMERVMELFPDLRGVLKRPAGKLSGGQRNMLAVGRALMSDPVVLLLDEATGGLAPMVARDLWVHVVELARAHDVAVVAVEQNVRLAMDFSDTVYVFGSGRNIIHGPSQELLARPDFNDLFLESQSQVSKLAPTTGA